MKRKDTYLIWYSECENGVLKTFDMNRNNFSYPNNASVFIVASHKKILFLYCFE